MNKKLQSEAMHNVALQVLKNNAIDITQIDITKEVLHKQDVLELFGISGRTLYTYRKMGKIKYFTFSNRCLYLKSLLATDILRCYND